MPRTCGDDPDAAQAAGKLGVKCPEPAGMIRARSVKSVTFYKTPRTCGDDPARAKV